MKYMLDTCALIMLIFEPERLSRKAREIIEGESELIVSIASLWEIMIKQQIGKLEVKDTSAQEIESVCKALDIDIIQTEIPQIDLIRTLPRFKDHGDPFDRLIICQAKHQNLPIITSDHKMTWYGLEVLW